MSYFDERLVIHVPEIRHEGRREASRADSLADLPGGNDRLLVRRGVVVDLPSSQADPDRRASLLAARTRAISDRMTTHHAVSHSSAALLHGLPVWSLPTLPEITAPNKNSTRDTPDYVRHTMPLPPEDIVVVDGLPVTSLDRTVVDLARFALPLEALVVADRVMARGSAVDRFDRRGTERRAAAVRRRWSARVTALPPRARGARTARAVVEWSTPWSESVRESWLRWVLLTWGRRDAVVQCPVLTPGGTYFTDLALPDGRFPDGSPRYLHNEYDGGGKYGAPDDEAAAAVEAAEREREHAITDLGHRVLRFSRDDGISAAEAVARITRTLRSPLDADLEPVVGLIPRRSQLARLRWVEPPADLLAS